MNLKNKPSSELHIQAIRRQIDPKRCSKKPFRNEGLRNIRLFSTRKSDSMFWKAVSDVGVDENLTNNELNVVPVMDVAEKKSMEGSTTMRDAWLSNSVKSSEGRRRITTHLENKPSSELHIQAIRRQIDPKRCSKKPFRNEGLRNIRLFSTRKSNSMFWKAVSDVGVDENLTNNELNVVPVMDVAEKKRMEGSTTMRDAWLSNSVKSSEGRTRITMHLENKPSSELHIQAIRRQIDPKRCSKKPFRNEGLRNIRLFSTRKSNSMFWKAVSDVGVDENLTNSELNVVPVMDVAEKKSMEGSTTMRDAWLSNSVKSSEGRRRITMHLENKPSSELHIQAIRRQIDPKRCSKKPFRNEGLRNIRLFSTRKSNSMFWKAVSDVGVDENLTNNELNVVPVMDVAEKKSMVDSDIGVDENLTDNKLNVVFDLVMDVARKRNKVVHDVHMDEKLANKRKAVAESVMDENVDGVTHKCRKVAFDADMDENLANNHRKVVSDVDIDENLTNYMRKEQPTVEIANSATQSDSKDPKSECPQNLIHQQRSALQPMVLMKNLYGQLLNK